jgi:TetR/AcrR family transcriptional repressor of nem operon
VSGIEVRGFGFGMNGTNPTKERLLEAGLNMLLRHGYNDLGIHLLLEETGVPKGGFYHHFRSKEAFALEVIDRYMTEVHQGLDQTLGDTTLPPLLRVRRFFETTGEKYRNDGYLGCMLGGLGQELSGINPVFQKRIEDCLCQIAGRVAECFEEARANGDIVADADPQSMANLIVNCWEGAALRSRLQRNDVPLRSMLDFYFGRVAAA